MYIGEIKLLLFFSLKGRSQVALHTYNFQVSLENAAFVDF